LLKVENKFTKYSFAGAFILSEQVLTSARKNGNKHLYEELLPSAMKRNTIINVYEPQRRYVLIDSAHSWHEAMFACLQEPLFEIRATKIKDSYFGRDTEIDFSSFVQGHCFLGNEVIMKENGLIENSLIGSSTSLGKTVKIRSTMIGDNVKINDQVLIENSIIADGCVIENNCQIINSVLNKNSLLTAYSIISGAAK